METRAPRGFNLLTFLIIITRVSDLYLNNFSRYLIVMVVDIQESITKSNEKI